VKEQLSLLETLLPAGAAPVWTALDVEQRALVVWTLARVMANTAVAQRESASAADEEQRHG
jgi:hypothetical protein